MRRLIEKRRNFVAKYQFLKKGSIMKKVLFAMMAMMVVLFTACTNKTQAPADGQAPDVEAAVNETTAALSEQIEAQDASKFQEILATVTEKVKEFITTNPEAAKEYITKIQEFLKENADKIKAFAGDNETLNDAINSLTAAPAESIVNSLSAAFDDAKGKAKEKADELKEDTKKALEDKANEVKEGLGI